MFEKRLAFGLLVVLFTSPVLVKSQEKEVDYSYFDYNLSFEERVGILVD